MRQVETFSSFSPFSHPPGGVEDPPVLLQPDKLVGRGDGVEVGLLPVVKVSVRLPNLLQHGDAEGERLRLGCGNVLEPLVHPGLPKVAVHRVSLSTQGRKEKRKFIVEQIKCQVN